MLQGTEKIESGHGSASGGFVGWAQYGGLYSNGPIRRTNEEAAEDEKRLREVVVAAFGKPIRPMVIAIVESGPPTLEEWASISPTQIEAEFLLPFLSDDVLIEVVEEYIAKKQASFFATELQRRLRLARQNS